MRNAIIRSAALAAFACAATFAQNSDLGLLLGASVRNSAVVSPGRIEGSVSAGFQINYAVQLHEAAAGRLYLELPLMISNDTRGVISTSISSSSSTTVFFTPGVRFHHTVHPRVALYAAAGGGLASLEGKVSTLGPGLLSARADRANSAAFGFGAGLDFRVTRLISIRAEGRDFVTRAGLGGERGRNHPFFTVGVGFHF
ncbi:MAG: outer membrane beta-barrel protein [Acidobacteria bacterium]|nr:outer membrane beta-barrel protein [Acidobacteriota bacterium]